MNEIKNCKGKVKAFLATTVLASVIFSGNVLASDLKLEVNKSKEFIKWESLSTEEKETLVMPRTFEVEVPESVLSNYELNNNIPSLLNQLLGKFDKRLENISEIASESRYSLADTLEMRVEHQGDTTECWGFSLLKSMETNIALKEGNEELENFSERHMDYATSKTFTDGVNPNAFDREVGFGGLFVVGLAYLTNGQGAVLESEMPFENQENRISLDEINKPVDTIVNDYAILPTIHKEYTKDYNGNTTAVKYYKVDKQTEYTEEELIAVRNIIKQHIVENGTIASMTGGNLSKFYNNSNAFQATAYNCNDSTKIRDHAISIVGWDDNYPKENFGEGKMPSTDGAYIVLNSYGEDSFDHGYIYISYEDFFIEQEIYGIESTGNVDYDKIYQHDYYGGVYQVGLNSQNTGYYGTLYEKDNTVDEVIESVGVTICDYANIEIYLNPTSAKLTKDSLIKVGESDGILNPGYHRININPTQLTGDGFAVVVKQTSENERFFFQIEANVENTAYGLVESSNKSYVSADGNSWNNLSNLTVEGLDMTKTDLCVKAFTKLGKLEPEIPSEPNIPTDPEVPSEPEVPTNPGEQEIELNSEVYEIQEEYIVNISYRTTKEELLNNLESNVELKIIDEDGNEIARQDIIKTGMVLKVSDTLEYVLVVRGDLNMDGNVSLVDLSKIVLHYNETIGFILEGAALKASDMNIDGKTSLVDVSQMIVLYNSI